MVVMQVWFEVHPDAVEQFVAATLENGGHTSQEPGNLRFELLRDQDNPHRFLLIEIYDDQDALDDHFVTEHFAVWRNVTDGMFKTDPVMTRYERLFPPSE